MLYTIGNIYKRDTKIDTLHAHWNTQTIGNVQYPLELGINNNT